MVEGFTFQFGKRFPPRRVSFSILENGVPQRGFHFPFWKTVSPKEDSISHFGKRFPPRRILFPILENGFPQGGFYFPFWKTVSPKEDSISHFGKHFPRVKKHSNMVSGGVFSKDNPSCRGEVALPQ